MTAESVRARLLNLAKLRDEDFQSILSGYAAERLLYRLGQSRYRDQFVLKGAILFRVWLGELHRPTKDLDLSGSGSPDLDGMIQFMAGLSTIQEDDGIVFEQASIRA